MSIETHTSKINKSDHRLMISIWKRLRLNHWTYMKHNQKLTKITSSSWCHLLTTQASITNRQRKLIRVQVMSFTTILWSQSAKLLPIKTWKMTHAISVLQTMSQIMPRRKHFRRTWKAAYKMIMITSILIISGSMIKNPSILNTNSMTMNPFRNSTINNT